MRTAHVCAAQLKDKQRLLRTEKEELKEMIRNGLMTPMEVHRAERRLEKRKMVCACGCGCRCVAAHAW